MDSEQREGIKEGMKARREGKVKPWREVKKELKPDQSRLLSDEEQKNLISALYQRRNDETTKCK